MDITRQGQFLGTNTATRNFRGLQNRDRPTGLGQANGRRESIRARADYDSIARRKIELGNCVWHSSKINASQLPMRASVADTATQIYCR